MVGSYFSLSSS